MRAPKELYYKVNSFGGFDINDFYYAFYDYGPDDNDDVELLILKEKDGKDCLYSLLYEGLYSLSLDFISDAILFQDSCAVGRIPVVIPVKWDIKADGTAWPVFGTDGKAPKRLNMVSLKPDHVYRSLTGSDDFKYDPFTMRTKDKINYGCYGFKSIWQFNHEPDLSLITCDAKKGKPWIETDKTVTNIFHARNILTQRMTFPGCMAEVTIDGSKLNDGDFAGLAVFQGDYALVGIRKKSGKLYAAMASYTNPSDDIWKLGEEPCLIKENVDMIDSSLRVRITAVFSDESGDRDTAICSIYEEGKWRTIGTEQKLRFRLDHFTGCRFGLFVYSEEMAGGQAGFSDFRYMDYEE